MIGFGKFGIGCRSGRGSLGEDARCGCLVYEVFEGFDAGYFVYVACNDFVEDACVGYFACKY